MVKQFFKKSPYNDFKTILSIKIVSFGRPLLIQQLFISFIQSSITF